MRTHMRDLDSTRSLLQTQRSGNSDLHLPPIKLARSSKSVTHMCIPAYNRSDKQTLSV